MKRKEQIQTSLSHCLQPFNLYSAVNAKNSLQACLCADFLQSIGRGFLSTQVFDSSRYWILHKKRRFKTRTIAVQRHEMCHTRKLHSHSSGVPCGAIFSHDQILFPQVQVGFALTPLQKHPDRIHFHWDISIWTEYFHSVVCNCVNAISSVMGVYSRVLSTSFNLASYTSKLLFMEMLKTSTI